MSQVKIRLRRIAAVSSLLLLLAACGGGGEGSADGGDAVPGALPTLSQDTVPSGARIDVAGLDLFPVHAGDEWVYEALGDSTGEVTRRVVSGPGADGRFVLSETEDGLAVPSDYRLTPEGIEAIDPLGTDEVWPGVQAALPSLLEYATPLYPVGGERKSVRQGDAGVDLDSDGRNDYFRIEISQVFRGFETIVVLGVDTETARFTNRFVFVVSTTGDASRYTVTGIEEAWFAPGIGLVRAERSASDSDGAVIEAPNTMNLIRARVDG